MASLHGTSVVIVNWNDIQSLRRCLETIHTLYGNTSLSTVVVDNGSDDGSADMVEREFPDVLLTRNENNRGFSGACNQGAAKTQRNYLLFLNPDAILRPGAIETLSTFLAAHTQAGGVGGALVDDQGLAQIGFNVRSFPTLMTFAYDLLLLHKLFPKGRVSREYRMMDWDHQTVREVDQPAGSFFMVRREAFDAVGGFDEIFYPAWFEDVDLCRRLTTAGWKIFFHPEAKAIHRGGSSVENLGWARFLPTYYRNMQRYTARHLGLGALLVLKPLLIIGMMVRLAAVTVAPRRMGLTRIEGYRAYLGSISEAWRTWRSVTHGS